MCPDLAVFLLFGPRERLQTIVPAIVLNLLYGIVVVATPPPLSCQPGLDTRLTAGGRSAPRVPVSHPFPFASPLHLLAPHLGFSRYLHCFPWRILPAGSWICRCLSLTVNNVSAEVKSRARAKNCSRGPLMCVKCWRVIFFNGSLSGSIIQAIQ